MISYRKLTLVATLGFAVATVAIAALAQNTPHNASEHASPAMAEYMTAMQKMQADMNVPPSGDADIDFVRMMIPHHQAAIDMAQSQLKYGKDPAIRKLAQDIIAAQKKEIAQMQAWLKSHDRR
jgi:uncharacterized protein (DUF305 family)